jgi:pyruvate ferredoxin oxidoreductase alpha subunit
MIMERVGLEGSIAIAEAVKLADTDVIAAYPITPQTHIVERLAEYVANGELDANYIPVESEHSAMSACLGSSAVGARTFTSTASQGLELMHEVLYVASSLRLPIVMVVADRALSGPLNVWGDHSDAMATRDCGWIQIFAENAQQAFDLVICAFRIAEDPDVLMPVMIHVDGFHLSHVIEPLYLLEHKQVEGFLPKYNHPYALNPDKPVTMGAFGAPNVYTEAKKAQVMAMVNSKKSILDVWQKFGKLSGRYYLPVEKYKADDADILLLTMGSYSETAMMAIDTLRGSGEKVGLIRLRLWRPFPFEEFRQAVANTKTIIVLDRSLSPGGPSGPVYSEIQSALYHLQSRPKIVNFVGGLGGRDMSAKTFENMIRLGIKKSEQGRLDEFEMIEVRE